ncbi:MAG: Crp/Fnr family transcriptional regulator [Bacteroidetes bacterium]|nr:Crp/Fnr family transcriptional regulator [Bacteroidota bacterium]MBU1579827.1 Crp/Fnr family transcriptional regulator [Bacteroidota bacterium]MBU2465589.1 Crp/Fnr family transcriptional regulator [Bacteroidota bacterium]MBU2557406.1 Crp/Fnr family transcriptional regulator [Bacteroidota bacterium]
MLKRRTDTCISCETCNERSPLFSLLSSEELRIMNTNRFEVVFNTGENIVKQGTSSTHMIMITNGMAKMYLEGFDKKNLMLEIITPWKLFGGPGLFTDYRYHYSVSAITETSACFISIDNVRKVLRLNPDFAEALLKHCSQNGVSNFQRLISLTQKQMHGRLADVLLYLSEKIYHSEHFNLNITRQEIGEMSNMTKESATRILKEFELAGIIKLDTKEINLLDVPKLKQLSLHG